MKILLAIDPYENERRMNSADYEELVNWCQDPRKDIKPVYVVSDLDTPMSEISDKLPARIKEFSELEIINLPGGNRSKEIDALLDCAKESGAELIALVSQGKSNIEKHILGSFAETLLLRAELPVFVLSESSQIQARENKVIFATDFSKSSFHGFSIFLQQIKDKKPEIIVYHAILLPQFASASPVYANALSMLPESYWQEQKQIAQEMGAQFISLAQKNGFVAKLEIANQVSSIERSIKEIMKTEKTRLVAMVSVSNPLQRFLIGSISRAFLRYQVRPIWICGPMMLNKKNLGE